MYCVIFHNPSRKAITPMRILKTSVSAIIVLCTATGVLSEQAPIRAMLRSALTRSYAMPRGHFSANKFHADQTTVTRMVRDSMTFFNDATRSFVPGGILSVSYSSDGRPESETQIVLNDSLAALRGFDNSKTLYNSDQQGHITTVTEQTQSNGAWINVTKYEYTPYINMPTDQNGYTSGNGFGVMCKGYSYYIPVQTAENPRWDRSSNKWINFSKMTFSSESNGTKTCTTLQWDTVSSAYDTVGSDIFFISGNLVTKTIMSISYQTLAFDMYAYATYDPSGNETEELQRAETFMGTYSGKIIQTFDSRNNLLSSIQQDSLDGWVSLDSCPKMLYTYAYDNAGLVVSRKDSSWYSDDSITVEKHFFTYQTFSAAIHPTLSSAAAKNLFISHCGMVRTSAPVSIDLYSLSGKHVGCASMSASGSLWKALRGGSVALSKGMYFAKIQGMPKSFAVRNE